MENKKVEVRDRIDWEEPITFMIGPIAQTAPAFMVWQLALQLKEGLVDKYEPTPGIPTPETPEPLPYFKRKEEEE